MPKPKREEAGSLSNYERQKLQKLCTQGGTAYGSVHNLVKTSNLPVTKVRQLLHSKPSYTKFTLTPRKFERMKAFSRFRNKNWCKHLAFVAKLAKDFNGVKYLLVRQDLVNRTVDVKGMKNKDCAQTIRALLTMLTTGTDSKKFGWRREQNLLEI